MQATARRVLVPTTLAALGAPLPGAALHRLGGRTMGTSWSVRAYLAPDDSPDRLRSGIEAALDRVVAAMSHWAPGSDLCRFNAAPPGAWCAIPPDFECVLRYALALARATGGAFDPTIGRLVDLWGFGPPGPVASPPADEALRALAAAGWRDVALAPGRARKPGGVALDLSAVAKGYAVDLVAALLDDAGVASHLVEIGGELRGTGVKPDGQPWWVALEEPLGGARQTVIALHGLSVATSGDAKRAFVAGGRRYGHTLDPRSGRPVDPRVAAVTVVADRCMAADALATALTVLGPARGMTYAIREGIAARFLLRKSERPEERITPAFAAMLA